MIEDASHLIKQALGEQSLEGATVLKLTGHWQQLTSLGTALHQCRSHRRGPLEKWAELAARLTDAASTTKAQFLL